MIRKAPGLDVSTLVRSVLQTVENQTPSQLEHDLGGVIGAHRGSVEGSENPYTRLFATETGLLAASLIGNETRTLDAISSLSLEVVFEHLREARKLDEAGSIRVLAVPGAATERPCLLILDPEIRDVAQSRRITDEVELVPEGLAAAFDRIRPHLADVADDRLVAAVDSVSVHAALEMLWVSLPEVVITRRPRMVPLCVSAPHMPIECGPAVSTAGMFCRDDQGVFGVTACYHGTGPVGTEVMIDAAARTVSRASQVQDTVFIPLPDSTPPAMWARGGIRRNPAPSEAEHVWFEGAGTRTKVATHVTSHDPGVCRRTGQLQLKVQTPPDTNRGDSGCALVDANDRVLGFASYRTGLDEFPEMTDWIWADNAMFALGLKAI